VDAHELAFTSSPFEKPREHLAPGAVRTGVRHDTMIEADLSEHRASIGIGESAVMVAVSSGHRTDAFPAARYVIDELKSRAPI
jgi:molybdopterin synthase catalytic subunit